MTKEENIEQHIKRDYEALFLSKSHYWKKEYEKRLLIISDSFCHLNIKESLSGVYYGLFTDRNYDVAIQQFIESKKTKTYGVYFEDNRLKKVERKRTINNIV